MKVSSNVLNTYKNGNYVVRIYNDGSKVRLTLDDDFNASFPESIDIKITNYCDNNCPMCHENSSINGKHAVLDYPFLNTLSSGTELAIGGGNPFSHPNLKDFLISMKEKGIICNITVNQNHFVKYLKVIKKLIDEKLIYGLGVSIIDESNIEEIINFAKENENVVIHLIAGLIKTSLLNKLYDKHLKVLILGYKEIGRGINYFNKSIKDNICYIKDNILEISSHFYVISFDNLAIDQLDIKNKMDKEEFEKYYMGDDGNFTMYIDLVKKEFAISSTSLKRHPLLENIKDMFEIVKMESKVYDR